MRIYNHKPIALRLPSAAPKRMGMGKKIIILLIAAGLGSAYHKISHWNYSGFSSGNFYKNIISHSPKYNTQNPKQNAEYDALMRSAFAGDVSLLPKGNMMYGGKFSSVNHLSPEGRSPLHIAAGNGAVDLAKELIKRGANVNLPNNSEQTPLHFAAWSNKLEIITLLLANMAKINAADKYGNTPLMFAVSRDNKDAVALLLSKNANRNIRNKAGQSATTIAEKKGFDDILGMLK